MRYLIDTHTLLWWVTEPDVLPRTILGLLEDRSNEVLISIGTPWELAIKTNTGKLDAAGILRDFEANLLAKDLEVLPASVAQVIKAGLLPLHHRDPFDRLLVAQALDQRVPIVSKDGFLDRYGVKRIWD